ncbi:ABC transporter permease [Rhizobium leguminosarum]|uniref:ABC transporter permease n=1 Tax=Rhizobium leguminosarum TaxID=384 RepID=UPI0014414FE1|nr:ABC transporter permease [Rhizobium leguminosarum]MBY5836293.1 ABC transporter permease [Rhizobium leguminosarum]NKM79015.1 ABC transporter permease subunit [Rhizobium leguminosarum bv. viciae]QSZ08611.1 ABC transporter permease [Rhizobium leguminosarum]
MNYLIRRVATALVTLFAVATLIFLLLYLVPGDPAEILMSGGGIAPSQEAVDALRANLGLDRPLWDQYLSYLAKIISGDLGTSFQDHASISGEIARRLPRTIELILAATIVSVLIGMPAGVLAALRRGGFWDGLFSSVASFGLSVPVFVTGTLMILVFSQILRLVPAGGYVEFTENPVQHLIYLTMPAISISVGLIPVVFRMTRSSILEFLEREWVRTARAKGLGEKRVLLRHVVRNSLSPIITVLGLHIGTLLGGTVLVEYVFNWPGLSGMLVQAVEQRDYPAVQGIVLVICILFVLINLGVDLLYGLLDPRVRIR